MFQSSAARLSEQVIERSDTLTSKPREISCRSASLSARHDRLRTGERMRHGSYWAMAWSLIGHGNISVRCYPISDKLEESREASAAP